MKAYLSTGNDEDRRHRYNASAEFEAEYILAETEPETGAHWKHGSAGWYGTPVGPVLAEALGQALESGTFNG